MRCNWATKPRKGARSLSELSTTETCGRDLETKLMKQSELLEEAVERKATLQNEINELEVRIAEEEAPGSLSPSS